jgi:hypothetical protein
MTKIEQTVNVFEGTLLSGGERDGMREQEAPLSCQLVLFNCSAMRD